jgi:hypothetical protein
MRFAQFGDKQRSQLCSIVNPPAVVGVGSSGWQLRATAERKHYIQWRAGSLAAVRQPLALLLIVSEMMCG